MALDAGIYGNLLARPRSAMEYQQDYAAMDDAKAARQLNALQMQDTRAKLADAELTRSDQTAYRNALAAMPAGATQDQLISTIEGVRNPYAMTQARELRKAQLEAQAKQTEISRNKATESHSNAQTDQIKAEQKQKALTRAMDDVMAAQSPQQAMQLVQQYSSILDPAALQGMTRELMGVQTPEQMDAWKYRRVAAIHGLKTAEDMKRQQRESASTLANRDLIEDPTQPGRFIANKPLQDFKLATAKAGASKTEVKINEGQKGFENETKLRDNFKQEPVYKAHQEMDSAHRQIKAALSKADPISDMAAATKIMKLLDPGSVVRESELGMAMAASGLMDRVTNYADNIVKGTKLTPTQRKEFGALADALDSEAVQQYDLKRTEYQRLGSDYGLNADRALGTVARPAPPPSKPKAAPAMGPGTRLKFDANGDPVQ